MRCRAEQRDPPFRGSGPLMNLLGFSPIVAMAVAVRRACTLAAGKRG
jgi:hypothetical protein